MMISIKESKLAVPAELVKKSRGLSIDLGASMFKAVYCSKEDLEEVKNQDVKMGHITLLSVASEHYREAVEHLSSHAQINRDDQVEGSVVVYTTGLGCTAHGKLMSDKLNIKIENLTELDCMVKGFHYLAAHLPRPDLFEKFDSEAAEKHLEASRQMLELFMNMKAEGQTAMAGAIGAMSAMGDPLAAFGEMVSDENIPVAEAERDLYPCLLAMCGSGFGYLLVDADGSFKMIDMSNRGGRAFYGLGTMLTGCQTFNELLELASHGNPRNVDVYTDSLMEGCVGKEGENNMYTKSATIEPILAHCFGKAIRAKLDDFKKEDLARSLLDHYILDTVQTTSLVATVAGAKRVVFSGSFLNSPLTRGLLTSEWVKRGLYTIMTGQVPVRFDFLKAGSQLCAIGALISHYEKFVVSGVTK